MTLCCRCSRTDYSFDSAFSAVAHAGAGAAVVRAFKFGGDHTLAAPMGSLMVAVAGTAAWQPLEDPSRVVIPIPSSRASRRARGFSGGNLLASSVARIVGREIVRPLLLASGTSQKALGLEQRTVHARAALSIARRTKGVPNHVLLVDDVMTTGATVSHAAHLLKEAGASSVSVLVFAMEY